LKGFESAGLVIEVAEIVVHEANEPNAIFDLLNAYGLTGEDLT
jgi:hypothetical protein